MYTDDQLLILCVENISKRTAFTVDYSRIYSCVLNSRVLFLHQIWSVFSLILKTETLDASLQMQMRMLGQCIESVQSATVARNHIARRMGKRVAKLRSM